MKPAKPVYVDRGVAFKLTPERWEHSWQYFVAYAMQRADLEHKKNNTAPCNHCVDKETNSRLSPFDRCESDGPGRACANCVFLGMEDGCSSWVSE